MVSTKGEKKKRSKQGRRHFSNTWLSARSASAETKAPRHHRRVWTLSISHFSFQIFSHCGINKGLLQPDSNALTSSNTRVNSDTVNKKGKSCLWEAASEATTVKKKLNWCFEHAGVWRARRRTKTRKKEGEEGKEGGSRSGSCADRFACSLLKHKSL